MRPFARKRHPCLRPKHAGATSAYVGVYVFIATALATVVLVALGRAAARVGGEAAFEREAEG